MNMKRCIALILTCLLALACVGAASAEDAPRYGFRGDETVEQRVIFDAEGLKITTTGLMLVRYAPVLSLRVENASGRTLGFELTESALNDWMWDADLCLYEKAGGGEDDSVEAVSWLSVVDGDALTCGLSYANEYYYAPCGITGFGELGFALRVFDPDSDETLFTTPAMDVATSLGADYPGVYRDVGTLAYDSGDVRVLIVGLSDEAYGGPRAQIYVSNYSDRPVLVTAERCAVNGTEAEPWFSAVVSDGRQCLAEMGFDDGIASIDRLAVAFRVEAFASNAETEPELIGVSETVEVEF